MQQQSYGAVENFTPAYSQMISGYDAERIIKIGQYLPKLQ